MAVSSRPVRRMIVQEVEEVEVREPKAKPRRKGMRRLFFFCILLAALIWFLPMILAKSPLLCWGVNRFGNLKGQVAIGSASLGWLSPPSLSGVELRDEKDQPVVEHLAVAGGNSLFGMILNPSNLGKFHIEKPKLTLRLRPDGSNLEDVISGYLTGGSSAKKIGLEIDIADAEIEIIDEAARHSWRMDQFALNVKLPAADTEPTTVKTSGRLVDSQRPGKLAANVSLNLEAKALTPSPSPQGARGTMNNDGARGALLNDLTLQAENFPLDILQPVLARCGVQAQTTGWLNADLHTTLADKGLSGKTTVEGSATAEGFALAMPALGKDQIRLTSFRADGKGTLDGDRIDLELASLACDLGDAQLSGSLQLHDAAGRSNLTASGLLRQKCELSGRVDLARLAAMLPQYLHVRERTQITGGEIRASFACRSTGATAGLPSSAGSSNTAGQASSATPATALAWQGQIQALGLRGTDNGRPIDWARPIAAGFIAHEEPRGIVVDSVQCDSDFLKITGSGTTDNLSAVATFNLKQLADQLGQFLDLPPLAGEGRITAAWRRDASQQFEANAQIQLQNFQVVLSDQTPWREPSLVTTLTAKGKTDFSLKNTVVDAAGLNLTAGADQMTAQLTAPIRDLTGGGTWPLRVTAQGQMQSWLSRAAAFAPLAGYQAAGAARLDAQLTASAENIQLDAKIHGEPFALASPSIYLDERVLDVSAAGSWNTNDRRLAINSAALTSGTLNAMAQVFTLSMPDAGPFELSGTVQFQGNLARLRQCIADRQQPPSWSLGGMLAGNAQFKQTGGVIRCETAAEIANLAVAEASGQQFQEPKIALAAIAEYDNKTKKVTLEKAEMSSSLVAASALGKVAMNERTSADINGQINYDLGRISDLLRPIFPDKQSRSRMGSKVRFFGRNVGPFSWTGPLSLADGRAATELKWDRAYIYGFDIGPAALKPKLEGGVLAVEPMQIPVSQGKLCVAPKVRLAPGPMELTMPPGPLAEKVQITPDMCDLFLKYISPILADVADAHGSFTLELTNCRLPLANPKMGDLAGKFIVHDVVIGPGPLIHELAVLLEREKPAQLRRESVVNFQMYQGRIHHDDMELIFPEFTIHTKGSVGIDDQTLQIEARMPIPPKWLVNNPAAPALKNQTLALPIAGTLSKPQLDRAKMEEYTRQFLRNAVIGGLEEGLNNGLNQLFRQPPRQ